ncbi:MAG: type II toxin-antitoxin system VapC family toxin [Nitrospirales bacterium]|nr:type II toxin-antitoxin system VapC family toxin [Nitrospirales bacterium]
MLDEHCIYFDTSALAKWYINEPRSDDVEEFLQKHGPVDISDLTIIEMRCLLSRRRRDKTIAPAMEMEIFATFQEDIRRRFLICHPLPKDIAPGAVNLMALLSDIPVRTLDALHLMIARELSSEVLVTADRIMAQSAEVLGFKVVLF